MNEPTDNREMLACMGDEARFLTVHALSQGERCVTELARKIGRSQSCTTRHLQVLSRGGIVRRERRGKRVVFALRLDDPRVLGLVEWALGGPAPGKPPLPVASAQRPSPRRATGQVRPGSQARPGAGPRAASGSEPPVRETDFEPVQTGPDEEHVEAKPGFGDLEDFLL